jgi:hypothetical protein
MMGERQVIQEAPFYGFSLERHVPSDHLLRKIDRFVDLSGSSAPNGRRDRYALSSAEQVLQHNQRYSRHSVASAKGLHRPKGDIDRGVGRASRRVGSGHRTGPSHRKESAIGHVEGNMRNAPSTPRDGSAASAMRRGGSAACDGEGAAATCRRRRRPDRNRPAAGAARERRPPEAAAECDALSEG